MSTEKKELDESTPVEVGYGEKTDDLTRIESVDSLAMKQLAEGEAVEQNALPIIEYSEEENRKVRRKIDMVVLPLMCLVYALQYVDRSAMGYAAIFTFIKDTHITTDEYAWLGSIYNFGYLVIEFPGAYLLQKMSISKSLSILVGVWGILLMCMAIPRSFAGLAVIRFLLGGAESLVSPGFVLLNARFYTAAEQPLRIGIWYGCQGVGSLVGSLVSYGMGSLKHTPNKMPTWTFIFLLNGAITFIGGVVCFIFMPESPTTSRFLTPHEKRIAIERVRGNKSSLSNKTIKWSQVYEAINPFIDPQGWLFVLSMWCLCIPNGGVANFQKLILKSYGFSSLETILVGIPTCFLQVVFPLSAGFVARKYKNAKIFVMMGWSLPSLIGFAFQYAVKINGVKLWGYYMMTSYVATISLIFGMTASNIAGYTKKVAISSMIFIAYASGNIAGPHLFISTEKIPYKTGMESSMICFCFLMVFLALLRLHYMRENARRDKILADRGETYDPNGGDFADLTDCENMHFRYKL